MKDPTVTESGDVPVQIRRGPAPSYVIRCLGVKRPCGVLAYRGGTSEDEAKAAAIKSSGFREHSDGKLYCRKCTRKLLEKAGRKQLVEA